MLEESVPTTPLKVAIHLRVSTAEQSCDNQRGEVVQLIKSRGYEVAAVYEEHASAVKRRREFDRMLADAHRGQFNGIVVWALDRFGRSMPGNLAAVVELDRIGVRVISVREPWLDAGGPARSLLIAIVSWVADQERRRISERTKSALARLKAKGVPIGRPRAQFDMNIALQLRAHGSSIRATAKKLKVGASTLARAYEAHDLLQGSAPKQGHSPMVADVPEIARAS